MHEVKFDFKTGELTARDYERVETPYTCQTCGAQFSVTLDMPSGITFDSELNVVNIQCPVCHSPVIFPKGKYRAENGKLVNDEPSPE